MTAKPRKRSKDPDERREDALRPNRYLGYNRDGLGIYFLEREAYAFAESQFRRAVWLNPFEPKFKLHWALALLKIERRQEAQRLLLELLQSDPAHQEARRMWNRYWPDTPVPGPVPDQSSERANVPHTQETPTSG